MCRGHPIIMGKTKMDLAYNFYYKIVPIHLDKRILERIRVQSFPNRAAPDGFRVHYVTLFKFKIVLLNCTRHCTIKFENSIDAHGIIGCSRIRKKEVLTEL